MMRRNVALIGPMGAGKSTIGRLLAEMMGAKLMPQAAALKAEVAAARGVTVEHLEANKADFRDDLQRLGHGMREHDPFYWCTRNSQRMGASAGPFVIDDMRYLSESIYFRSLRNFIVIGVYTPDFIRAERYKKTYGRPPTPEQLNHPSESEFTEIQPNFIVYGYNPPGDVARHILYRLDNPETFNHPWYWHDPLKQWYLDPIKARALYESKALKEKRRNLIHNLNQSRNFYR